MSGHKLNIKFYQNLAKFFYAITNAEKTSQKEEIDILKATIKKEWLQIDEIIDIFGTDTAYQMEVVFDWLYVKKATCKDCLDDFVEYYHNHLFFFTDDIKKIIIETALKIVNVMLYDKKNKLKLIGLLQVEFNKDVSEYESN